jgi:transcriptional regulator with XRE-family HTH domain
MKPPPSWIGPSRLDGTLGAKIREERVRRGLTIVKLARKAGVSRRHLSALEAGGNVSVILLVRIAAVLQLESLPAGRELRLQMTALPKKQPPDRGELEERLAKVQMAVEDCRKLLAESD